MSTLAILGGGTAGFIAAAHFSRHLPQARLLHVFDTAIPTIGVGEGTTPRFPGWLEEITGLGFEALAERCGATLKKGTRFDGWGAGGEVFLNRFQPTRLVAYHFDAAALVRVLAEHVRATRIDARVEAIDSRAEGVAVRLADGSVLDCDFVFDARGFPPGSAALRQGGAAPADPELIALDWIPTGRALLRRLPAGSVPGLEGVTRAAARPHGWVFQIPLQGWTSCGYIHHPGLATAAEVEADFTAFLHGEGVTQWEARGSLDFPNFVRRRWFDGRVFSGGNAALFLEPLEATAIGSAIVQVRNATRWMQEHPPGTAMDASDVADEIEALNAVMLANVCRDSLFLAWHYACGSRWDTPFWRWARQGLARARAHPLAAPHLRAMAPYIAAGRQVPGAEIAACEDPARWEREVLPQLRLFKPFGNFSELNFAQIGHGIGYYDAGLGPRRRAAAATHGLPP